ncbi:Disease resistance protein (NBS-LRR class) family [Raphanus sativus]|nr:Disease resistance protein (NBS-LRR class) family [Raphanus sativus]
MLVKVLNCLMRDDVQKMGIWGMGGVGKTTLVRELNNKLWKEADTQPLGESEETLAKRIYGRLEKVSRFLLILDDVWKPIDLDQLGIPDTNIHKASKIVLTSRFLEVCQSIKTDIDFRVDCLCEEEAWQLFCKNAGEVTRLDCVEPIAKEVSRECGGLPLAIITVGMAMRGKKMVELWEHAFEELKSSVPYVKKDYSIEVAELVRYWIAEGFIDETQNHGYLMNQGITLAENLKDSCLLEEGAHGDTVKMHDVVRILPFGSCLPHEMVVTLLSCLLTRLPNQVVECVELSALLLHGNFHLEELPVGFLISFPALRILNLSGTRIKSLPHSLSELHELRSLILKDCYYLEEVPSLESLAKFKNHPTVVKFRGSRHDLSHFHWGVQGQTQEGQATLEEIACLQRLSILSIRVVCVPLSPLSTIPWIERLKKFQLFIGPTANSLPSRHDKRRVTISSLNVSEAFIGWLLTKTTSLVMNHCWGLNEMLENLVIDSTSSFNMLRSLTVEGFGGSIRPAGGCVAQLDLIPNLEELHLRRVNLGTIRELVGHLGLRFETLKTSRSQQM